VSWLDDDEAGHGSAGHVDLALSEHQAAAQELSPFGIALSGIAIGVQNAVQVIGNCAADPGRRLRHWLSLAARRGWFQSGTPGRGGRERRVACLSACCQHLIYLYRLPL
jgi:hypothetical protein